MRSILRTWGFLISFSIIPCLLFSQDKAELSFGAGYPDFINMKIKFGKEVQIYGGAGFFPIETASSFTAGLDIHFPLISNNNKTRKFYLENGAIIMTSPNLKVSDQDRLFVMCSRIGFSFYNYAYKDRAGFDFDFGILYDVGPKYETYNRPPFQGRPTTYREKRERIVLPAVSLSYFFKL